MSVSDTQFLALYEIFPEIEKDPEQFLIKMTQVYQSIAQGVNAREIGVYDVIENSDGKLFFGANNQTKRDGFRTVVDFGQLPNTAAKSVAHGLPVTSTWRWTHIYATATDPTGVTGIPVPNSFILVDNTNVTITTTSDLTAYTACYVVLEYVKEA